MAQYDKLADIYDYLVSSVDYEGWMDYIEELLFHFNKQARVMVDLACGTGNTTIPPTKRGYQVIGVDLAGEMLAKAREKSAAQGLQIEYLEQNMCELKLGEQADLFTCYHDGLNYILNETDLAQVFRSVFEYLKPGGLFIFDLVNVRKLAMANGDTTYLEENGLSLVWETNFLLPEEIWQINLTCFVKQGELYEKFQETHQEKAHSRQDIEKLISATGFRLLGVFHSFTLQPADDNTYRLFFVVEKPA